MTFLAGYVEKKNWHKNQISHPTEELRPEAGKIFANKRAAISESFQLSSANLGHKLCAANERDVFDAFPYRSCVVKCVVWGFKRFVYRLRVVDSVAVCFPFEEIRVDDFWRVWVRLYVRWCGLRFIDALMIACVSQEFMVMLWMRCCSWFCMGCDEYFSDPI